jgi:hypothetical protein
VPATPQRIDPLPPRSFAANMVRRVQYEQQALMHNKPPPALPSSGATRTREDLLGEKQVPADAYYGVQTAPCSRELPVSRRSDETHTLSSSMRLRS